MWARNSTGSPFASLPHAASSVASISLAAKPLASKHFAATPLAGCLSLACPPLVQSKRECHLKIPLLGTNITDSALASSLM